MVEGVDKVTVTSDRGEYWRLLLPGHYKSVWTNTTQYRFLRGGDKDKDKDKDNDFLKV